MLLKLDIWFVSLLVGQC